MSITILVTDDESIIRDSIAEFLESEGYQTMTASNGEEALEIVKKHDIDLLLSDVRMPGIDGIELMNEVNLISSETLIILMTAFASVESAIQALRSGAADYMLKPLDFEELLMRIQAILERRNLIRENRYMREVIDRSYNFGFIIGESQVMKDLYRVIEKVGATRSTVLVTGPSGSGKELIARALHQRSERKNKPFVAINCGSIPESLFESELFGHRKGSFTGAVTDRDGHFVLANGGTLFLDEIGEMPLSMQVKLLRVLQESHVSPVGAAKPVAVDVRIIAATNRNLEKEVEDGRFREDLFYRLNIIRINAPGLSQRRDDIPLLAQYFLEKHNRELRTSVKGVSKEALQLMMQHEWKGQVRELQNVMERAVLLTESEFIQPEDLPFGDIKTGGLAAADTTSSDAVLQEAGAAPLNDVVASFEKQYIRHMLDKFEGNRSETARALHIDPSTLYRKMEKLGLTSEL
ncbi:MAG: two-component signal transduction system NtrC family response regulator [Bacteroidetes bacterium HLUCCA01]|nr:MAG: two-component signal transduction system NtrC family response regulator [Bacteroidetes bacterium HLUCCA01]